MPPLNQKLDARIISCNFVACIIQTVRLFHHNGLFWL